MRKLLFAAALLGLLFLAAACAKYAEPQTGTQTETPVETETGTDIGIANPASVFCEAHGGQLKMVEDEAGVQGICVLADGKECDEWEYYRGECPAAA